MFCNSDLLRFDISSIVENIVVGVDEAGRGCLAGPVVAGAVILNGSVAVSDDIRDSKLISEKRREELFESIVHDHRVGIGFANIKEIKELNILHASLLAMKRAFMSLKLSGKELGDCHVLIDGNQKLKDFSYKQTTLIKGDQRVKAISAASIVAKVSRDRVLRQLHLKYPEYGFISHKGYATQTHLQAIRKFGPCSEHREMFAGVREHWSRVRATTATVEI